jgi:hypothetical protein
VQKNRKMGFSEDDVVEQHTGRPVRSRYQVAAPEVVDIDVLSTMLDEDLLTRFKTLNDEVSRLYENGGADPRPWEEEIAYLRREQQVRRDRRDAHANYIAKEAYEFNRLEASLPAGDFDNSDFVYAAQGGRPKFEGRSGDREGRSYSPRNG